jgi:sulfate permease, SulP family
MPHLLTRRVPLLGVLRDDPRRHLRGDVTAGLTTGVMLVPQAMAYAALAGMPPVTGLYASVAPVAVYAVLGTSGALAFGPVAIVALLTASTVAPLADGDPATYIVLASALALLVGAIQVVLAALRGGAVVSLLSHAVISGFTTAAALVIAASQVPALTGMDVDGGGTFVGAAVRLVGALGTAHPLTVVVGVGSVAALLALRRWAPRVPGPLVVVVLATTVAWLAALDDRGVALLGEVPSGLPIPQVPGVALEQLRPLLFPAVVIALLSYVEGISVAKAIAARTGERIDPTQELVASGGANLAAGLVQAFPVAGGFSRTAVNHQAGARTPLAGLVTAGVVALAALVLTPLFTPMPRAVLAAIVVVAVSGLVDLRAIARAWRIDRAELAVLLVTLTATLVLGVEVGIAVGIGAGLVLRLARRVHAGARPGRL